MILSTSFQTPQWKNDMKRRLLNLMKSGLTLEQAATHTGVSSELVARLVGEVLKHDDTEV